MVWPAVIAAVGGYIGTQQKTRKPPPLIDPRITERQLLTKETAQAFRDILPQFQRKEFVYGGEGGYAPYQQFGGRELAEEYLGTEYPTYGVEREELGRYLDAAPEETAAYKSIAERQRLGKTQRLRDIRRDMPAGSSAEAVARATEMMQDPMLDIAAQIEALKPGYARRWSELEEREPELRYERAERAGGFETLYTGFAREREREEARRREVEAQFTLTGLGQATTVAGTKEGAVRREPSPTYYTPPEYGAAAGFMESLGTMWGKREPSVRTQWETAGSPVPQPYGLTIPRRTPTIATGRY